MAGPLVHIYHHSCEAHTFKGLEGYVLPLPDVMLPLISLLPLLLVFLMLLLLLLLLVFWMLLLLLLLDSLLLLLLLLLVAHCRHC